MISQKQHITPSVAYSVFKFAWQNVFKATSVVTLAVRLWIMEEPCSPESLINDTESGHAILINIPGKHNRCCLTVWLQFNRNAKSLWDLFWINSWLGVMWPAWVTKRPMTVFCTSVTPYSWYHVYSENIVDIKSSFGDIHVVYKTFSHGQVNISSCIYWSMP